MDGNTYGKSYEVLTSIFDAGTFVELGAYTKRQGSSDNLEGVVCGYGSVDGKLVFAIVQDSERTKGAFSQRHARKICDTYSLAIKNGAPVVFVFDSAGAVVYDGASALAAYGSVMKCVSEASGIIPQIALVNGICGGMGAVIASMLDITIAIEGTSKLYVNPPFTVGGGAPKDSAAAGNAAYLAQNTAEAYAFVRRLACMLPSNNADPSLEDATDDLNRALCFDAASYKADELVKLIADNGELVQLYKTYAENFVLGFARIGGILTGIVAADPEKDGIIDIKSARAISKLVGFCDSFGIPVLTLVDSCGLEVSAAAEAQAYASELAKLAYAYTASECAKVTVIVGKAYGAAFSLLGAKATGADMVFALPDATVSVLSPEASVAFVWNDRIGQQSREELEAEWKKSIASATDAADRGEIDDIIDPAELRQRIAASLMMLASKAEGTPARRHANMPL